MPLSDISAEYRQNIATLSFQGEPEAEFLDQYFERSLKQVRVFDRFHQADEEYSRKYNGAGLGLALTKSLVERHGGRICVQSKGEGQGATFRFFIPIVPSPAANDSGI